MTIEDNTEKAVNLFLNSLKDKNLLLFHHTNLGKNKSRSLKFIDFNDHLISVYRKLAKIQTTVFTTEEIMAIYWSISIFSLSLMLEELKIRLIDSLNPNKIKIDDNPTYGVLMNRISDKLGYDEKLKNELFDLFSVDLRNVLAHSDFDIEMEEITYKKKNQLLKLKPDDFTNIFKKNNAITKTILEFQGIDTTKS